MYLTLRISYARGEADYLLSDNLLCPGVPQSLQGSYGGFVTGKRQHLAALSITLVAHWQGARLAQYTQQIQIRPYLSDLAVNNAIEMADHCFVFFRHELLSCS